MDLKIGTTNVGNMYLGETLVDKVYLGEVEVYPPTPTPPTPSGPTWTIKRNTNGETMAEFTVTQADMPEDISCNGTLYYQIASLSDDGQSFVVNEIQDGSVASTTTVSSGNPLEADFDGFTVAFQISLPSNYHITVDTFCTT
jgi:hypothetical protein